MSKVKEFIWQAVRIAILSGIAAVSFGVVSAWSGPTGTAPGSNTAAPINTSATAQTKAGNFTANAIISANYLYAGNGTSYMASNGDIYMQWYGGWLSTYLSNLNSSASSGKSGGGFEYTSGGACYVANALTGGCSCPGYAPSARYAYYMDTNSTYGGGRGYVCTN